MGQGGPGERGTRGNRGHGGTDGARGTERDRTAGGCRPARGRTGAPSERGSGGRGVRPVPRLACCGRSRASAAAAAVPRAVRRRTARVRSGPPPRAAEAAQRLVLVAGVRAQRGLAGHDASARRASAASRGAAGTAPTCGPRADPAGSRRRKVVDGPAAQAQRVGQHARVPGSASTMSAAKMPSAMNSGVAADVERLRAGAGARARCRRRGRSYGPCGTARTIAATAASASQDRGESQSMSELPSTSGSVGSSPSL